jgi:NADH:ubiquinone oxidoreductase subunit C
MFESVRGLIDSRLGQNIVIDDFVSDDGFFIKIPPSELYSVAFFLKNDPDVRLTLLDQIIPLPTDVLPWKLPSREKSTWEFLYQLKSLKLPYRVTLVIEIADDARLMSIVQLYAGARWQEADLYAAYGFSFEEGDKRYESFS